MPVATLLLCFRATRSSPSELINWSTFLSGLDADQKNQFVSHFSQFDSEQIQNRLDETGMNIIGSSTTSVLCYSESLQNRLNSDNNNNGPWSSLLLNTYPESIVLPEITRYLNRLDSMGYRVISSTVDSSVESNCNKKCYTWTLQSSSVAGHCCSSSVDSSECASPRHSQEWR